MGNVNQEDFDKIMCQYLFRDGNLNKEDNEILTDIFVIFARTNKHVPYDLITKQVYEINNSEKLNNLCESVQEKVDGINSTNDEELEIKINNLSSDILRHMRLSISQKMYIIKESSNAAKISKEAVEKAKEAEDIVNKYSEEMDNIKKNIYTDFISILGIFTAITFATFGGLQLLGNVFGQNISDDNHALGSALVLGSLYIFGMYLLLIALLTGISKLTNPDVENEYQYSGSVMKLISFFCSILLGSGIYLVLHF